MAMMETHTERTVSASPTPRQRGADKIARRGKKRLWIFSILALGARSLGRYTAPATSDPVKTVESEMTHAVTTTPSLDSRLTRHVKTSLLRTVRQDFIRIPSAGVGRKGGGSSSGGPGGPGQVGGAFWVRQSPPLAGGRRGRSTEYSPKPKAQTDRATIC
jgi:hypothetical protein